MTIKFVDTDDERGSGSDLVGRYLAKQFIADLEKKDDEAKKAKDKLKKPDPVKISMINALILMIAAAPFVGMSLGTLILTWMIHMKTLAQQLN